MELTSNSVHAASITQAIQSQPFDFEAGQVEHNDSSTQMRGCSAKRIFKKICKISGVIAGAAGVGSGFGIGIANRINRNKMGDPISFGSRILNIQSCSENATILLEQSHARISRSIDRILSHSSVELSIENHKQLATCFNNEVESCATYVCSDDYDLCKKTNRISVLGYFSPPASHNNEAYFCMDNINSLYNDKNQLDCMLDEVMVHEVAHYVGVESSPDHNEPDGEKNDRVYRVGDAAYEVCMNSTQKNNGVILA